MGLFEDLGIDFSKEPRGYCIDIALLIDVTQGMKPILEELKKNAKNFCNKFFERMEYDHGFNVDELRIKVIPFGDYKYDGTRAMEDSGFFSLPEQNEEYAEYLNQIKAQGGGDDSANALEAIALAMKSDWTTNGSRRRHIILVLTDASAVPLKDSERMKNPAYPECMPDSLEELEAGLVGKGQCFSMPEAKAARFVVFAPDVYPWNKMMNWDKVWISYSQSGEGLVELDIDTIIALLVYCTG